MRIVPAIFLVIIVALIRCAFSDAEAAERYSAHATLQRAQVGTFSQQPRPTATYRAPSAGRFDRMKCYPNPAARLLPTIICERN